MAHTHVSPSFPVNPLKITQNGSDYTIDFSLISSNEGPIGGETVVCFEDNQGFQTCYRVIINVNNHCIVDPEACQYHIDYYTYGLRCDVEDDVAIFNIRVVLNLEDAILEGFEVCDNTPVNSDVGLADPLGYGAYVITSSGYINAFDLVVPCDEIPATAMIDINFCHPDGREFCVTVEIDLECADCDKNKSGGRSLIVENDYSFYPIPANDQLFVEIHKKYSDISINLKMYNSAGQEVLSDRLVRNENILDISGLNNGIYIIKLHDGETVIAKKIIVQR